ncbi:MAG: DUF4231 domain-containing protein [Saprospiraceae bacterium]|nr:DUF4231 domain-containing protein [Saprospiraceae bacterium]
MANTTVTPTSPTPAGQQQYDPIKMLRDYLSATTDAPPHFGNFLINRLGDQITWYDKKSGFFKRKWESARRWVIILSAAIPFLVGLIGLTFGDGQSNPIFDLIIKIIVGAAGVTIAILEGFNSLYKSQEHYIDYRMTAEKLRQEFSFFMGRSGPYTGLSAEGAYSLLVSQAEDIMAKENNKWAEISRQNDKAAASDDIQNAVKAYLEKHGVTLVPGATVSGGQTTPAPEIPAQPEAPVPAEPVAPAEPPVVSDVQPPAQPEAVVLPEEEGIDPADRNPEGVN